MTPLKKTLLIWGLFFTAITMQSILAKSTLELVLLPGGIFFMGGFFAGVYAYPKGNTHKENLLATIGVIAGLLWIGILSMLCGLLNIDIW